jgi:hypothetical protein
MAQDVREFIFRYMYVNYKKKNQFIFFASRTRGADDFIMHVPNQLIML